MSIELVTFLMFGGLILCLLLGLPLAWSLGGVAVVVGLIKWGPGGLMMIVYNTFGGMWSIVLVAIPCLCRWEFYWNVPALLRHFLKQSTGGQAGYAGVLPWGWW